MSRWGRGRGGVAVPLDSALFRENSNCPTAARSAGTVGKWGITSFTSIRSAPFAYTSSIQKKPVQDQNSPLTVPAVDSDQPPPKPKKFFKSRNTETLPPVPQILYAPPPPLIPLSPDRGSHSKGGKGKKGRSYTRDSSSPELAPKKSSEKSRGRKNSVATKAAKKEETTSEDARPPNKRYLVRTRNKVVNYAEDGSNSPIPDFTRYEALQPRLQPSSKPASPKPTPSVSSPTYVKPSLISPSSCKDEGDDKKPPPIVLRISKGTSRIVSTDSNEGFTSPNSDRHSSMDMHSDALSDQKTSPSMETICSPKHEGLKITIKCAGLTQEGNKKVKKKEKRDHKSYKKHHKNTDDESPSKKHSSPKPGSDTYDLYKTLASPGPEANKPSMEEIESQLAELDSGPPAKSPKYDNDHHSKSPPEPKPPERASGRSRRNRTKVNYNENDDYLDAVTSKRLIPKTVHELKKEVKKGKRRSETLVAEVPEDQETPEIEEPTPIENNDLIDILSGGDSETKKPEARKGKLHKKHKHKNLAKQVTPPPQETEIPTEEDIKEPELAETDSNEDVALSEIQKEIKADDIADNPNPSSPEPKLDNPVTETTDPDEGKGPKSPVPPFKPPQDVSEEEASHSEDKPSVKLVITKKKGSIFKSKSLVSENSPLPARKRRHLYRHEWNDKGNETPRPETKPTEDTNAENASGEITDELIRVTRYRAPDPMMDGMDAGDSVKPYTSVKCAKEAKEYYTVVRNVKKAHQIQEIGEFQEFNDDVDYLLDACQDNNPISTRCLSAITLATKCTAAAFRMHLRAHGTVQKFFSALHDATNDQSLGLCTATVMFVLSQDRLNMDLDRESLELMLNLLESDASHKNALDDCGLTSAQLTKTQERVRELCAEIKNQGKAKDLDLDNITVGHLAMETLLSLTSKRAGEWFKEELRALGGIDHIVKTIQDCVLRLQPPTTQWPPQNVDVLRKADRCMRVLENVTQQNEENQLYLISGGRSRVCETLATLLSVCVHGLGAQLGGGGGGGGGAGAGAGALGALQAPLHTALLDATLPALKVLVNLSHSSLANALLGANAVGQQVSVMENCLILLNNQNNFVPDDRNFEFSVCVLLLLINLVQNNEANADRLLNIRIRVDSDADIMAARIPALELIVQLFYKREDLAKRAEENTDALLDNQVQPDKDKKKQSQDDIDETVAKLLARAGTHMEHTMCGAYIALLLGHIAVASPTLAASVRQRVTSYAPLLPTLTKYYKFLSLTASAEATIVAHVKATHRIIKFMETSDQEHDPTPPASHQVNNVSHNYYQTSPSDMPQDMSINNLTYNNSYSSSGSDRMSSSMEVDSYH